MVFMYVVGCDCVDYDVDRKMDKKVIYKSGYE